MYSDDELGKLDGPGPYVNWADMAGIRPKSNKARTAKGSMTKRQRKAARKAERKAKRLAAKAARTQDEFFAELVPVEILAKQSHTRSRVRQPSASRRVRRLGSAATGSLPSHDFTITPRLGAHKQRYENDEQLTSK